LKREVERTIGKCRKGFIGGSNGELCGEGSVGANQLVRSDIFALENVGGEVSRENCEPYKHTVTETAKWQLVDHIDAMWKDIVK